VRPKGPSSWWSPISLGIAALLLLLAPLPALRTLTTVHIPTGLDPVDLLVVAAITVAVLTGVRLRSHEWVWLGAACGLNLALLLGAWLRRYGHEITRETIALYAHPVAIVVAGTLGALLAGRGESRRTNVALVMAIGFVILGLSIFVDGLGFYSPPVPKLTGPLALQRNGGFMLQGNEAGALYATYAVPCAVLLAAIGRQRLAVALLAFSLVAIAVTGSRESIGTFGVTLLVGALLTGRIARVRYAVVALVAFVSAWAIAAPGAFANISSDTNSFLSGRPTLWRDALHYLAKDDHWLVGGGLGGYERYVQGKLGHPFTTHSEPLRLLVDGGVLMLLGYLVLIVVLWWLAGRVGGPIGLALRTAVFGFVLIGLVKDFGPFTRPAAWLWALAALALAALDEREPQQSA
jgi:O-Antigen ligase